MYFNRLSPAATLRIVDQEGRKKQHNYELIATTQARYGGNLDQHGSGKVKGLDSACVVKVKSAEFADAFEMGHERQKSRMTPNFWPKHLSV